MSSLFETALLILPDTKSPDLNTKQQHMKTASKDCPELLPLPQVEQDLDLLCSDSELSSDSTKLKPSNIDSPSVTFEQRLEILESGTVFQHYGTTHLQNVLDDQLELSTHSQVGMKEKLTASKTTTDEQIFTIDPEMKNSSTSLIEKVATQISGTLLEQHSEIKRNNSNPNVFRACLYCKKALKSSEDLRSHHIIRENSQSVNKCCLCSKTFIDISIFKKHIKMHDLEIPNESVEHSELKSSSKLTDKEKKTSVDVPEEPTPSEAQLVINPDKQAKSKQFGCKHCGQVFSEMSRLSQHMKLHTSDKSSRRKSRGRKILSCSYCGQAFNHKGHLNKHILSHTGEKPHKCSLCGKGFSQKGHLNIHMMTHSGEKPHKCDHCGKAFSQLGTLNIHLLMHTGEKTHQCNQCEKAFSRKDCLNIHLLTHTGEKSHKCDYCGKAFSRKNNLKGHILTHTEEKPYKCTDCGKMFRHKQTLNRHVLIHSGEKPHKCSDCGKAFSQLGSLNNHILTHTKREKSHMCSACGKVFSWKDTLKAHMLLHSDDNPNKCGHCGKMFNGKRDLNAHLLLHSGEKPHKCSHCGDSFRLKNTLKRHFMSHFREKSHS